MKRIYKFIIILGNSASLSYTAYIHNWQLNTIILLTNINKEKYIVYQFYSVNQRENDKMIAGI